MINRQLASELLSEHTQRNHYRLIKTLLLIQTLIVVITAYLEMIGMSSPAITYEAIVKVGSIGYVILGGLYLAVKYYGHRRWMKWMVMAAVILILTVFRTAANDAQETHALFYLAILLSLFYFDPWLTGFVALLCMGTDMMLIKIYPSMYPLGHQSYLIRYLVYFWAGLTAAFGTQVTKSLIGVAVDLREANIRLMEVIERERELERMRKEFIAQVSHELKSPLGLIGGYAEALRDDIKQEKRHHYLGIIIDEVRKMGNLINNMLSLSQLEGGYVRLRPRRFNISNLTGNLIERFRDVTEERGVSLQLTAAREVMVNGDPVQVEHVLDGEFSYQCLPVHPGRRGYRDILVDGGRSGAD